MTVTMNRKGKKKKKTADVEFLIQPLPPEGYMWFRGALLQKPEHPTQWVAKGQREKVKIDPPVVELMAMLLCSTNEIAEWYGIAPRALYYRMVQQPEIRTAFRRGRISALQRIRAKQMEVATTHGDVRMLIHLGKQYLGQFDRAVLPADALVIDEGLEFAAAVEDEYDKEIDGIIDNIKKLEAAKKTRR